MADLQEKPMTETQLRNLRRQRTKEMRLQLTGFSFMIFLTFIAFGMVALEFDPTFIMGSVMLFAFIQVVLQFYYFMHMKDKGHDFAKLFMIVGMYFAIAFCVTFIYIVWIGQPI
ncbi:MULTISPECIES: cytochrome C oxidase subunit IV family protein [Jeotgalicoccus]|jgi:Heme/copper-type cytochrome/quinol oxidase, subunit 4|uniref:Cytochrome C oxidase subunit IV family protein n=1 Tax=Jeotgalicoccus nanhaiensis TaxID=568603 RepID=A0ABR9XV79_9STAP|nr:cytochrome C oxidase subunit IV family protein [Jeotgalicoccus nanhaiensis]MBF0752772.1 cytochrome C oxidase subunit IV family protein [Jeotgalicoccus nanhaiensis]TFU62938.1 cytochrome B6 [Jeotgalicoccus nanhaiensis]